MTPLLGVLLDGCEWLLLCYIEHATLNGVTVSNALQPQHEQNSVPHSQAYPYVQLPILQLASE